MLHGAEVRNLGLQGAQAGLGSSAQLLRMFLAYHVHSQPACLPACGLQIRLIRLLDVLEGQPLKLLDLLLASQEVVPACSFPSSDDVIRSLSP